MQQYHEPASAGNNTGLPKFGPPAIPNGLTSGGKLVYRRTLRPVETCNALAEIAGIGCGVVK
ncbi:hypothetical protein [Devosia naphthalenivorans]|uniref:hypothetical protein n=1 Tax=Devosia naphthalenivorans TaxID=2082392 RepID=UPI000D390DA4|nr:hypothetical protein [Devosia naphthalenivorans]